MVDHYPTVAEITAALTEQAITVPSTLAAIVAAVITTWEQETGYVPFLGSDTVVERTFDPPFKVRDWVMSLEGGFWDVDLVEIDGTTVAATYYDLLPLNAAADGRGWNEIRFRSHPGSLPASVVVTGKRGYAEELPDDVYQALFDEMQRRAILKSQAGGDKPSEVKQYGVTVKLASGSESSLEEIQTRFSDLIWNYRRFS